MKTKKKKKKKNQREPPSNTPVSPIQLPTSPTHSIVSRGTTSIAHQPNPTHITRSKTHARLKRLHLRHLSFSSSLTTAVSRLGRTKHPRHQGQHSTNTPSTAAAAAESNLSLSHTNLAFFISQMECMRIAAASTTLIFVPFKG